MNLPTLLPQLLCLVVIGVTFGVGVAGDHGSLPTAASAHHHNPSRHDHEPTTLPPCHRRPRCDDLHRWPQQPHQGDAALVEPVYITLRNPKPHNVATVLARNRSMAAQTAVTGLLPRPFFAVPTSDPCLQRFKEPVVEGSAGGAIVSSPIS